MRWIPPLILLIVFETLADIFAKNWSLDQNRFWAWGSLFFYMVANSFWLFALKNGSRLAREAVIFCVLTGVIAVALGAWIYKEPLSKTQTGGLILGIVAIVLLFWE